MSNSNNNRVVTFDCIEIIELGTSSSSSSSSSGRKGCGRRPLHHHPHQSRPSLMGPRRTIVDLDVYEVTRKRRRSGRELLLSATQPSSLSSSSSSEEDDDDDEEEESSSFSASFSSLEEEEVVDDTTLDASSPTSININNGFNTNNARMNSHEDLISAIDDEVLRLLQRVEEITSRIGGGTSTSSNGTNNNNNHNAGNHKENNNKKHSSGTESPTQVLDQSSLEQKEGVARCA